MQPFQHLFQFLAQFQPSGSTCVVPKTKNNIMRQPARGTTWLSSSLRKQAVASPWSPKILKKQHSCSSSSCPCLSRMGIIIIIIIIECQILIQCRRVLSLPTKNPDVQSFQLLLLARPTCFQHPGSYLLRENNSNSTNNNLNLLDYICCLQSLKQMKKLY